MTLSALLHALVIFCRCTERKPGGDATVHNIYTITIYTVKQIG